MKKYKKTKAKKTSGVIMCLRCKTDLRPKNYYLHKELNHEVKIYDHDPRDKRYEAKELIDTKNQNRV